MKIDEINAEIERLTKQSQALGAQIDALRAKRALISGKLDDLIHARIVKENPYSGAELLRKAAK